MGRRSEHSREEIRKMALDAAEQIVAEQGYSGLTARKVAAAIGYTVGSLYLVFRNLDDLALQVNARTMDDLYRRLRDTTARCQVPKDCIMALAHGYIAYASEHRHRWNMLFEHRLPEGQALPDWYQQKVTRFFELVEQQLVEIIGPNSPQKVMLAARSLWSGVHGICILGLSHKLDSVGISSVQPLVDSLIQNYLAGLMESVE
jgi:AcrR family transcriptional regulator